MKLRKNEKKNLEHGNAQRRINSCSIIIRDFLTCNCELRAHQQKVKIADVEVCKLCPQAPELSGIPIIGKWHFFSDQIRIIKTPIFPPLIIICEQVEFVYVFGWKTLGHRTTFSTLF